MAETICISVNGAALQVIAGTSVAAALMMAETASRLSVCGESRSPVCGMGVCFECRATVNGRPHQRTCLIQCVDGMQVTTNG